jgi:CBS domain containing-hemolysin-like protein
MKPFSLMFRLMLRSLVRLEKPTEEEQEEEIRLLAERSVESGALSDSERQLITNALSLDDLRVENIMTPRTVVTFLDGDATVEEVCRDFKNIPFARLPVYGENTDDIIGLVRRRDILQSYSEDKDTLTMQELMGEVVYVPETASALDALQLFLKKHQQFAVVVDEYGSTAGVISMEDIVEHLIGEEIYEDSDVAVDMRELARRRAQRRAGVTEFVAIDEPAALTEGLLRPGESKLPPAPPASPSGR